MELVRWEPFEGLNKVQSRINELFDDTFGRPRTYAKAPAGAWLPPVDILESKDSYLICAELPGMKKEDISIEVIDLRTLVPLDFATVLKSIRKTGKLLIAHEAARNCGFGAELAARAAEEAFLFLDAPILRVAGADCPVPYCKDLEEEVLPQAADIEEALRTLLAF